jgi:hypothetical protein
MALKSTGPSSWLAGAGVDATSIGNAARMEIKDNDRIMK